MSDSKVPLLDSLLNVFPEYPTLSATEIECQSSRVSLESREISEFLSGKRWTAIDLEELKKYKGDSSAMLSFISDKAFVYFFPAFLTIGLKEYHAADLQFTYSMYKFLPTQGENEKVEGYRRTRIAQFSSQQLRVIRDVFFYIRDHYSDELEAEEISEAIATIDRMLNPLSPQAM